MPFPGDDRLEEFRRLKASPPKPQRVPWGSELAMSTGRPVASARAVPKGYKEARLDRPLVGGGKDLTQRERNHKSGNYSDLWRHPSTVP